MVGQAISIHALREEGDFFALGKKFTSFQFLSTPSARRATRCGRSSSGSLPQFLSTPSARRATHYAFNPENKVAISIHALREEGDPMTKPCSSKLFVFLSTPSARRATSCLLRAWQCACISIHALREEGDDSVSLCAVQPTNFYPRPPRGGRQR